MLNYSWDFSWSTVVLRAFTIQFAPLIYHVLDISGNQNILIASYHRKSKNVMYVWSFSSYILLGLIYEFICPTGEDELRYVRGITLTDFIYRNKKISLIVLLFSSLILYLLILRWAFVKHNHHHQYHSHP